MTSTTTPELALDPVAELARKGGTEYLFPTPIFWHKFEQVDALNAELRELILAQERATPSAVKSNAGGWQSPTDVFRWEAPAVATLRRLAAAAVEVATSRLPLPQGFRGEFHLSGWAAVNRAGHYNTVHVHPMATWSGVYYVDPGDESADAGGGLLEFCHPITAAAMTFFPGALPSARLVRPEAGLVILFPSYLQHSVRLYHGQRPRICVPFNAHLRAT
ncbi:MAG TPA: TIGR02466 family protein [Gemmatimonadales bacterium]